MEEKTRRPGTGNVGPDSGPCPSSAPEPACLLLTGPDRESAARLYTEVFTADEPTTHRCALDPEAFFGYANFYVGTLVRKELSFLARDTLTGEIAGFIFCVDLTDDPEKEGPVMVEFISHFAETMAMINELEDRHIERAAIQPGSVLHIFQIGVNRDFRSRGIAHAMIRRVLAHARERGFRQVIADCTSPSSKKVFEECGFCERGFSPYESFSINGVRFFAGLKGGIALMVKDL